MRHVVFIVAVAVLSLGLANGQTLRFANAFSDGAVLQHSDTIKIWGFDVPSRSVSIKCSWIDTTIAVQTEYPTGRWLVEVPTPAAGFAKHTITATSATQITRLKNIVFGDVWFCSGQSNMEMPMSRSEQWDLDIEGLEEAVATANYPYVRYLNVHRDESFTKKIDNSTAGWSEVSPQSVEWLSAVAFFFARELFNSENIPIGLIVNAYGGSSIESWIPRAVATDSIYESYKQSLNEQYASGAEKPQYQSLSALYNGLINPYVDYGIRGFLWYQGEANVGRHDTYPQMMQDLVGTWRSAWGDQTLPFYFVQIAPWNYSQADDFKAGKWSAFAISQREEVANNIEYCEIVETTDLGMADNIHPPKKYEIGERLSRIALNLVYGHSDKKWQSPRAISASQSGRKLKIEFSHAEQGLTLDNDAASMFEVSADGTNYTKVERTTAKGAVVTLQLNSAEPIKFVRYCHDDTSHSNLFNSEGLSVGPFQLNVDKL